MNKILLAIIAVLVAVLIFTVVNKNGGDFGSLSQLPNAYSEGVTNSSTTVATSTGTSILARNANRQWAKICNNGAGTVWIYETATTTGVVTSMGIPIASTTAYEHCYTIDSNHPYIGQVYGIADVVTIIKYIEK